MSLPYNQFEPDHLIGFKDEEIIQGAVANVAGWLGKGLTTQCGVLSIVEI